VLVVGFDPDQPLGAPWNVVEGRVADLKLDDNVFVDELYKQKLGVTRVGDVCEIRGHRARIAGFTRGLRSFTTSPYIFTSFKNAQNYVSLPADQTARPGSTSWPAG
jgi:putative ABC transport system permease protein